MLYILVLISFFCVLINYYLDFNFNLILVFLFGTALFYAYKKDKIIAYFLYSAVILTILSFSSYHGLIENGLEYRMRVKKDGDMITLLSINSKKIKDRVYININDDKIENGFYTMDGIVNNLIKAEHYSSVDIEILDIRDGRLNFLRDFFRKKIYELSYERDKSLYGFLKASILGEKSDIDEKVLEDFRELGIAHILVISGLHIAFFLMIILKISELINLNYKGKYIFSFVVLTIYCMTVGMTASVFRAYIMAAIFILSKLMFEETELIKTLSVAFIISHIFDPFALFSLSFQLSYGAVLAIIYLYPLIKRENKIYNIFALSFSIQIFLMPLNIYYFKKIAIFTAVSNLIIAPTASILIQISLVSILTLTIIPFVSEYLALFIKFIWDIVLAYSHYFVKIPFMNIDCNGNFGISYIVIFYILLSSFLYYYRRLKIRIEKK